MDLASLIGSLLGLTLIVVSILIAPGATIGGFIDYPSIVMVLGGCIAATMTCFPLRNLFGLGKILKNVFLNRSEDLRTLIEQIVSLAETARRDGLLALESRLEDVSNPFLTLGVQMAVDGTRPEVIEDILRTEMDAVATRHRNGKNVVDQLGKFAPAFGMIGTLVGLVIMLGNMEDPAAIGPGMAVALLTTLYGAIVANVLFLPWSEKLANINRDELLAMEIIVRGILCIQSGENPRVIDQKLSTFLPPRLRKKAETA